MSIPDTSIPAQLTSPPVESEIILPVVEIITQDLIDSLKRVRKANGYQTDLQVERIWRSGNTTQDMLCVVQEVDDELDDQAAPTMAAAWVQPYALIILAFQPEASTYPVRRRLQIAAADVHKSLMKDYQRTVTNQTGDVSYAVDTRPPTKAWCGDVMGAADGLVMIVRVQYRTDINDPYKPR